MNPDKTVCILNIGNTHVQKVIFTNGAAGDIQTIETAVFEPDFIPQNIPCAAASVVPEISEKLQQKNVFFVNASGNLPFRLAVDVRTVGADRLANAAQLVAEGTLPALCFDFGTAVTCEYVDEKKCFSGGAILPGRQLMRKALNLFTAQLPQVPLYDSETSFPAANTTDAIRLGTDSSLVAAVKNIILKAQAITPDSLLRVTACGGDRAFFLNAVQGMTDAGGLFTLSGIKNIWEYNHAR